MKISVDFSNVQSQSAVPAGEYQSVISNVLLKEKPGAEHPYLNWEVTIVEGEHEGRKQYMTTSFTPAALWKMMEVFQNLGFEPGSDFVMEFDDQTGQLTSPDVIGLPCVVQIFNEPYNGRMTSKISSILNSNAQPEVSVKVAATPATGPATKTSPAAAKNGPATAPKRSPFPASGVKRSFK